MTLPIGTDFLLEGFEARYGVGKAAARVSGSTGSTGRNVGVPHDDEASRDGVRP